jgi:hypothetical protein
MSDPEHLHSRRLPLARVFGVGFVVGAVITIPAVFFALLSPVGEALLRILIPGSLLLRPIADAMASWPGLLNFGLLAIANGLIYGLVAVALVRVLSVMRG